MRPSSNTRRAMDIEQFYIEKRDNFACFISDLHAKYGVAANTHPLDLEYAVFQGYKLLLRAAIAGRTVDSYTKKFLLQDCINIKQVPAERLSKLKRYLKMFSKL